MSFVLAPHPWVYSVRPVADSSSTTCSADVTPADPSSKRDILQAVYEDNLHAASRAPQPRRIRRLAPPRPTVQPRPASRWMPAALLGLAGLLVAGVLGLGKEPPPPAARAGIVAGPSLIVPTLSVPTLGATGRASAETSPTRLPMAELFNLQVNTIVLDPGHGGRDPGALGADGMREKDVTLDVARRLRDRLARSGARVLLTRETDVAVPLQDRVAFANEHGADLFVSLHVNSIPDPDVAPLETYYFGLGGDATALRLAHGENAAADYSVAEFNDLLERAGTTVKLEESKHLAESVQASLVARVREVSAEADDWGVKAGPFVVLLGVEAPAILAEMAAISNADEEARLGTDAHRETLARSLEEGIAAYLQDRPFTNLTNTPDGEENHD